MRSTPAATSHLLRPNSQKPSKRPEATLARSSAAEPSRRTPCERGVNSRIYLTFGLSFRVRVGKLVQRRLVESVATFDTATFLPLNRAPSPRAAVYNSL